ncbi:decaprenyl-diphosphate synthase subunit 2 [Aplysia californica]|uniref:Decaprenyl-diphosphate synthase subunit 2 n=1 Tax=Aplysia californica TaxID=6500 RepID=A0ABM1ABT6_APLCA|nr:decaprenyl-diphosphate synthase subunit 2 [Aplysia californica]XP_005110594.1 decaprenyl-diphosphate synthase subunit 2 [Aplysia californica]XP_012944702.1 decaprenyl-diphosphate synthase subunit 2 [Aplysia californica]
MSKTVLSVCDKCVRNLTRVNNSSVHHARTLSAGVKLSTKHRRRLATSQAPPVFSLASHQLSNPGQDNAAVWRSCQSRGYRFSWLNGDTGVSKAVSEAEKIVGYPTSFLSLRCLFSDELSTVALHIRKLVGTKHPLLKTARGLVFDGKHNLQMRGLLVMLISKAAGPNPDAEYAEQEMVSGVYPNQRSLAEITEVIHTANLIHKGVVNLRDVLPEDGPLSDLEFGNKMAVLSGDYLLASACTGLAKLENPTVLEKIAQSIGDMMTAEFTNFSDASGRPEMPDHCKGLSDWLSQTYLSIGSLVAKSCQSAMILAGHSATFQSMAFAYGENMAYAQQLCSDLLPFLRRDELSSLSLTSAPLYMYKEQATAEQFSRLQQLLEAGPDNYEKVVNLVTGSGVVQQCKDLCGQYRDKAIASLGCYADSEAKEALINMVTVVSDVR